MDKHTAAAKKANTLITIEGNRAHIEEFLAAAIRAEERHELAMHVSYASDELHLKTPIVERIHEHAGDLKKAMPKPDDYGVTLLFEKAGTCTGTDPDCVAEKTLDSAGNAHVVLNLNEVNYRTIASAYQSKPYAYP